MQKHLHRHAQNNVLPAIWYPVDQSITTHKINLHRKKWDEGIYVNMECSNEQGTSWGRWAQSFWWALVDIMEHTSECPTWVVRKLSYSSCISHLTLSEGCFQGVLLPRASGTSCLCQEQALGWWVRLRCLQWDAFGLYGDNEGQCDTGGALPVSAVMGQWHRSGQPQAPST